MTVLLIILAIIILILILPFGATVRYLDGEFSAALRVLAFDFTVFPAKEKKPKKAKKPKKPKKEKEEKPPEEKPKRKLPFTPEEILQLLKLLLDTLSRFRRKLTVNRFKLYFVAAADDPADAAMLFGFANAALGYLDGAAGRAFDIRSRDVKTAVDFESTEMYADAELTITISLGRILAVVIAAGVGFLKIKRQSSKNKDRAQSAEERKDKDGAGTEEPDGRIHAGQPD